MKFLPGKNILNIAALSIISVSLINLIIVFNYNKSSKKNIPTKKFECSHEKKKCAKAIDDQLLIKSLDAGTEYLLRNQKEDGSFYYNYNISIGNHLQDDNQIRQAEVLWGLVQIYNYNRNPKILTTLKKGFDFFINNLKKTDEMSWVVYPSGKTGKIGTQAMTAMAMIDFLKTEKEKAPVLYNKIEIEIHNVMQTILKSRNSDKRFHQYYDYNNGKGFGKPTAYSDTQCVLSLVKYIKHFQKDELIPEIIESADETYKKNITDVIVLDPESKKAKNFFKWGSMLTYELSVSGWKGTEEFSVKTIELSDWIIDVYNIMIQNKNVSYAVEGIIFGYMTALEKDDNERQMRYSCILNCLMRKLFTFQIGGPVQLESTKKFINDNTIGGVLISRISPLLRIDLTYKQMDAIVLILKNLNKKKIQD